MVVDYRDGAGYGEFDVVAVEVTYDSERISQLAREARARGGQVLVDAGCGGSLSLDATGGSLVIAEDPSLGSVNTREVQVDAKSTVVGFNEKTDALPEGLNPDLFLFVAPDPGEIGPILYEIDRIKGQRTKVLIVFDNTSYEGSGGGLARGVDEAIAALQEMGFKMKKHVGSVDDFSKILNHLGVHSGGNIASRHIFGGRIIYLAAFPK